MDELKPCPFCGNIQQLNYVELSNGLHYIECARCGAAPHRLGARDRETAVKYWNSVNRWISCSESLPKSVGNKVLVFCTGEDVNDYVGFGHYENFKHIETWYNLETGFPFANWGLTVTHWIPRPEPPEKEDADDS